MQALRQYRHLPTQIYILCTVRLIADVGLMFVTPFLSLICTSRLGFTTVQTGFIVMGISLGNIIGSLLGGRLADTVGRRRTALWMIFAVVVIETVAGFHCESRWVLIYMLFGFIANAAMVPATMAILVDLTDETNRNESISLLYIFCNLGVALGPFLAGILFYRHMSWIFYCMAFFFAPAFLLTFFCIQEPALDVRPADTVNTDKKTKSKANENSRINRETKGETDNKDSKGDSLLKVVLQRPVLLLFVIILFLIFLCYTELGYLLPIQFSDLYGVSKGSKMISAMWTVNGIVVVLVTPILVSFMKKRDALVNMAIGCLIYAIGFATYTLPNVGYILVMASAAFWTCGEILVNTETTVYLAKVAPATHAGRVMSLFEFCRAGGKMVGPILCSFVLAFINYHFLWGIISLICLLLVLVITALRRNELKRQSMLAVHGE